MNDWHIYPQQWIYLLIVNNMLLQYLCTITNTLHVHLMCLFFCRCMAVIQRKNYRIMPKILRLNYEVKVLVKSKWLSQVKITFKHTARQHGARCKVSDIYQTPVVSLCITHSKNFVLFLGQLKRISKPVQEKFDSDWLFLLILGIIVALISFGLDFSIDKCQQGI